MASLPTGTVTFLFTDVEGSTKLWERSPEAMRRALARHDEILRRVTEEREGYVFKTIGDAFCCAYPTALAALEAALEAQRALFAEEWGFEGGVRVRMGLHTGQRRREMATTSVLRLTGWRGCSPPGTAGRCCFRFPPTRWCETGSPPGPPLRTWENIA